MNKEKQVKQTKTNRDLSRKLATERAKCKRLAISIVNTFRDEALANTGVCRNTAFVCDDIIQSITDEWRLLAPRRSK